MYVRTTSFSNRVCGTFSLSLICSLYSKSRNFLIIPSLYCRYPIPTVFFDRNSAGFNTVLDIYRTGKLHFTEKSCALVMKFDFDYWGIDEMMLEPCCALKYYPEMEVCSKEQEGERESKKRMQVRSLGWI